MYKFGNFSGEFAAWCYPGHWFLPTFTLKKRWWRYLTVGLGFERHPPRAFWWWNSSVIIYLGPLHIAVTFGGV